MRLDQLSPGDRGRVVSLEGGRGMQQRLNQLGIHPGDTITLSARGAFHGPLLVVVHGMRVALGRGVARRVQVELLEHGCPATLGRRGRHRHAHR